MMKAAWKVDNNEEAIYIDGVDDYGNGEEIHEYSHWCNLPDILLEEIFSYLSIRERYYASMVCRCWYRAFHLQKVWEVFTLEDNTLTRRKFNYYYGWQHVLDHLRTQMCLISVGRNFRHLVFEPMMNFYNLFEFMNMLSFFAERQDSEHLVVGPKIKSLKFTFPCNMAAQEEHARIYGTGGRLLEALKRLMGNLKSLRSLQLIDLMLEPVEAQHLLDDVCIFCGLTLQNLMIINTTKIMYQLLHVGVFLNLQVLYISPQNIGEDLLQLLGFTKLRHLHVIQNRYTPTEVVRERVSTSTVLLLAHTACNMRYLYVRRNAVILRCDWPWSPEWSAEFYQWLRASSRSYESTEKEVSQIFKRSWYMLSDQQFKMTNVDLHASVY